MRTTHKVLLAFGILLFSVLLSSFYSPNIYAADLTYNLNDYDWITSVNLGTQYCAYSYNTFGSSPSICLLNRTNPNMYGIRSYDIAHEKGDLAEFYIGVQNNIRGSNIGLNFGFFMDNFGTINDNYKIISVEKVIDTVYYNSESGSTIICDTSNEHFLECNQYSGYLGTDEYTSNLYSNVYKITILFNTKGSHPIGLSALNANTPIGTCKIADGLGLNPGAQCQVRIFGFTQWGYVGSDTKKAIDNQTQQQQNQYNQEKQEESQRENQGNADSSQAQGLFNFNVLNPFANLWNAFNSSGCVSIPTIASMLHSSNTTYCPWFPSSVRSTVTPVMAIASSMLLFGFVVRWLSGNSGDIYGARNMNKELNG